jgi:hypothetical protein
VNALRRLLARLLLRGHFLGLGERVLPEASVVILRDGAMVAYKIHGKLNVRCSPGKPLKFVTVLGPARLNLTIRPLFRSTAGSVHRTLSGARFAKGRQSSAFSATAPFLVGATPTAAQRQRRLQERESWVVI